MESREGYGDAQSVFGAMQSGQFHAPDNSPNPLGKGSNLWDNSKSGIDWGGTFSSLFEKAAQNRFSDNDPYGKGSTGFGGGNWGSQNSVDIGGGNTVVTTGGGSPMYIPGEKSKSNAGAIGGLIGGALMAPFTSGMSLGAAMGAIGGASSLGSMAGSMFG
jgi:hypothetical protein